MGSSTNQKVLIIGILVLAASVFCLDGQEKLLAIKGGQIHTITDGIIENGVILIRDGLIEDIGPDVLVPSDAEVLDHSGSFIMPGVVSPHSYLGIPPPSAAEQSAVFRSGPAIANLAHYPVRYSIYPEDPVYLMALKNGLTTMAISPRPGGIAGLGAVIQPGGERLKDILVKEKAFLKVNVYVNTLFWDMLKRALDEAQKKIEEKKKKAEEKKQEKEKDKEKKKGKSEKEAEEEEEEKIKESTQILMDVVEGRLPLMADCYSPSALSHLDALLSGFPKVKVVVVGGPEIYRAGSLLKEKNIPVILSPEIRTVIRWSRAERTNYVLKCQGLGLKMAFQPPGGIQEQIHLFDYLNKLALYGVNKDVLLKGVTIVPAEILGMEKVVGSLEKGKRADLIVFPNNPLENIPVIENVLSGGIYVK
ncbi:MAG: amidohydrolase family protein [Candidatus Aminicenantes bacterium]|nr:MAG: amidohydrolase family protein [Candidatus Aminicenantes bacterium]